MDHRGLGERREHLVRALRGVIRPSLERSGPERRMEAREPVPGFVHDHLDAFRVRRLDDGREVVAQPVVGAGGENDRLGVRVPADRGKDGLFRHRTVQAVLGVDRGIEIDRMAAREHHAVVHRLVAVAVEQQLFAGGEQRLENDLVRGRGAVGREESAARAEGLGGDGLRLGDHTGGLHQRVEHFHRHRKIGVEDMLAHEIVEIIDPGAAAQRLAG